MNPTVHVAFTLRPDKRTPKAAARAREIAESMGFEATGGGLATLSFRASPEVVAEVLGTEVQPVPERAPGETDFGAPAGFAAVAPAQVPAELSEWVEAVSVVPPARRFN